MSLRCLSDVSQMSLRCLSAVSQAYLVILSEHTILVYILSSISIVKVRWEKISRKAQDHGAEVNTVYTGTSPIWYSCRTPPKNLWLFSTLQCDWIGTNVIGVHHLQLGIDLLPELLGVSSGEEAGHDGG